MYAGPPRYLSPTISNIRKVEAKQIAQKSKNKFSNMINDKKSIQALFKEINYE